MKMYNLFTSPAYHSLERTVKYTDSIFVGFEIPITKLFPDFHSF